MGLYGWALRGQMSSPPRLIKPLWWRESRQSLQGCQSKKGGLEMRESTQRHLLGLVAIGRGGLASRVSSPRAWVPIPLEKTSLSSKHREEKYLLCLLYRAYAFCL